MVSDYESAKKSLLTLQDLSVRQFFDRHGCVLELAYCKLLDDDLEGAKELFELKKDEDIRAHWGAFLISLIKNDIREYPSYFELRNFLEIDLDILISYYKGDYVENILRYADFLFNINPEVYKFIGRVLYNNGLGEQALFFLRRAKDYFYNDPELHYLLAYVYYEKGDIQNAVHFLKTCLKVLPQYFPAKNLLKKIPN